LVDVLVDLLHIQIDAALEREEWKGNKESRRGSGVAKDAGQHFAFGDGPPSLGKELTLMVDRGFWARSWKRT
jgi:hypothetical protein